MYITRRSGFSHRIINVKMKAVRKQVNKDSEHGMTKTGERDKNYDVPNELSICSRRSSTVQSADDDDSEGREA